MKLATGIGLLRARNFEKKISKKIALANTNERVITKEAQKRTFGDSNNPLYAPADVKTNLFNPDIRFRYDFAYSPLTGINYRNDLLIFAENNEIKKAVKIMANECVVMETDMNKYPVYPELNLQIVEKDKEKTANAIQDYLDKVFFPKLFQWYNFKEEGLIEIVKEFLITGKLCYEIIYNSLTKPTEIIGLQPLDPTTLQKYKQGDNIFYVQRQAMGASGSNTDRILHENQVILCEWNEYDFGYISYVDMLRRPFNIMRSMQSSKILWFAAKSQVRMHIKLALGDVSRDEAINRLVEAKEKYQSQFRFEDNGVVTFNEQPNNIGYREIFTGETAGSGHPEIEEINTQGPDLTETDSLNYWGKLFWAETEIPLDRVDPQSSETWGFADVNNLRKIEVNFGKYINGIRKMLNPLFLKPIIIQLTLKEVEIGVDLSLLDSIKMKWVAFNHYEMMAELEVLNKRVELAQSIANFGEYTDVNDKPRKAIPLLWIIKTFLDFTKEQMSSMEEDRIRENLMLGFNADGTIPEGLGDDSMEGEDSFGDEEFEDEEPFENEESMVDDEHPLVSMYQNGEISKEEIMRLIDNDELTSSDISALQNAGIIVENVADEDDANF